MPPKLTSGTLEPPRGRTYATVAEAQRAFDSGRTFRLHDAASRAVWVVSKEDFAPGAELRVKVARGTVTGRLEVR